jgi:MFS family permease
MAAEETAGGASGAAASAEARFQREVRTHLRRNFGAHLVHGLLGQTGFRLVNAPTFMPAYVHLLSGSDQIVGLARGLQSLGMFLSPILGATVIEHRRRVLPVGFVVGGLMRVQVLGIALAGFLLAPAWALPATLVFLGLFGFFLGMQGVVFNFLVSKVVPLELRGRLLGLRNALAGVVAAGVSLVGGHLVDRDLLGNGYAATFGIAFALTTLGLVSLAFVREPATPEVRDAAPVGERLRQLPALLRSDREFTLYFLARALGAMGRMAMPFYVLYAGTRMEVGGRELGLLTLGFVLANSVGNLLWGAVADRRGFRAIFLASLVLWVVSTLVLIEAGSFANVFAAYAGIGMGLGGFMMSAQNLVLEFGSRRNLPMRIAVANSATELVGAVGPIAGGMLSAAFSYVTVFWLAMAFQVASILMVWRYVGEPRARAG